MFSQARTARLAAAATLGLLVAACGSTAASAPPGSTPTAMESAAGAGTLDNVDVCSIVSTAEIQSVMGVAAHDPQASMMGPGASIDGAVGCTWQLGDSIDLFDVWIYPSASMDLKTALGQFWDGYTVEPISGVGDEAYAAVWRGDAAIRTVGQVAGVGVRKGGNTVLLSTLLIGEDYTNPNPAAQLALTILGRI